MTSKQKEVLNHIFGQYLTILDGICMDEPERTVELMWPELYKPLTGDEETDYELRKDYFHMVDHYISDLTSEMKKLMR